MRSRIILPTHDSSQINNRSRQSKKPYSHNILTRSNRRTKIKAGRANSSEALGFVSLIVVAFVVYILFKGTISTIQFIFGGGQHVHNLKTVYDPMYVNNEADMIRSLSSVLSSKPETWPVSIRNEEDSFETITHPADEEISLDVPKFYIDMPLGEGKLMTKNIASMIGSYSDPEGQKNNSPDSRTIFVSIASYRNWQCRETVENLYQRATYPERIRVGIVDQIEEGLDISCNLPLQDCLNYPEQALCKFNDRIDVFEMEASFAVGPIFARHIANRLYRGEYYALQINSHVSFVTGWDVSLIEQHDATKNEMAILTTHLTDLEGSIDEETGKSLRNTRPIMCNTNFDGVGHEKHLRHFSQPETQASIIGSPQLEPYWATGFSFARGHFVVNVPYDPYLPMVFQGEEISMGLRAFTYGYDCYAPEQSVCFNSYIEDNNGGGVKIFLENADLYQGVEKNSMARLLGVVHMNPEIDLFSWKQDELDKYGTGQVRELSKFYATFGIHVQVKRTEHRLCDFVSSGQMHNMFVPFLRPDGMGINYDKIKYRFHELATIHE